MVRRLKRIGRRGERRVATLRRRCRLAGEKPSPTDGACFRCLTSQSNVPSPKGSDADARHVTGSDVIVGAASRVDTEPTRLDASPATSSPTSRHDATSPACGREPNGSERAGRRFDSRRWARRSDEPPPSASRPRDDPSRDDPSRGRFVPCPRCMSVSGTRARPKPNQPTVYGVLQG